MHESSDSTRESVKPGTSPQAVLEGPRGHRIWWNLALSKSHPFAPGLHQICVGKKSALPLRTTVSKLFPLWKNGWATVSRWGHGYCMGTRSHTVPQDDRWGTEGWQIRRQDPRGGSSCHLATMCPLASCLQRDIWIELASFFLSNEWAHSHAHRPFSCLEDKTSLQMEGAGTWPFPPLAFKLPTDLTSSPSWGAGLSQLSDLKRADFTLALG